MDVQTLPKMGTTHRCLLGATSRCGARIGGAPKTAKCRACGGAWLVQQGWFGVFAWTGDGRYPVANAVSLHATERMADKRIDADTTGTLVVRWVTA